EREGAERRSARARVGGPIGIHSRWGEGLEKPLPTKKEAGGATAWSRRPRLGTRRRGQLVRLTSVRVRAHGGSHFSSILVTLYDPPPATCQRLRASDRPVTGQALGRRSMVGDDVSVGGASAPVLAAG